MTRQYGLDKSTAEYVTFVDQDDELYGNDSIGTVIKNLKSTGINYLCTNYIEEAITTIGTIIEVKVDKTDGRETLHGVFLKREFLINNNVRFKPGFRVHDDFYLRRILQSIESPVFFDVTTYLWKYNEDSQVRVKRKYDYLVETFEEYFRATKETNSFMIENNRYDAFNIVSSIIGLFIILESNKFDAIDLQPLREKYEKELYEFIAECNEQIELVKSEIDGIFKSQMKLMVNSTPDLKVNETFFEFIQRLSKKYPEIKYKEMNNGRFLDFIIPYYNGDDKVIESLMNSIMSQKSISLMELGVIFVSDASPKDIPDYILTSKYPFIHIEYLKLESNKGQGLARQYGVDNSTAKYVTYVDQDDMLFGPDALSIVISNLKKFNPEMLYTDYIRYNPLTKERRIISYKDLSCLHGVFFERKKLVDKNIRFSDLFRMYEDTYYMIIAGNVLEAKYLNYPTYIWIERDTSQTTLLNDGKIMIVDHFKDYLLANIEAAKYLISNDYKNEEQLKNILYTLFCILKSNLFKDKDVFEYEKMLFNYYVELKKIYEFNDEQANIERAVNHIRKDHITEITENFDDFVTRMSEN